MVGVAEKGYASFRLDVSMLPGHSSMPPRQTAIGILGGALGRLEEAQMPLRSEGLAQQFFETLAPEMDGFNRIALSNYWLFRPMLDRKLEKIPSMNALMRTTTAPTMVSAGNKDNVLPGTASATVNFRLLPGDTIADVKAHIQKTVANDAVRVSEYGNFNIEASNVASTAAPEFAHLSRTVQEIFPGVVVAPALMIGATDSRHMRSLSSNVFKFTPLQASPEDLTRFHGTNERISVAAYAGMIRFYHQLAKNTAQ
jgi:carboxypeptidase PM20D1